VHHRHAVFDRDRLPATGLNVDIAAGENGKDQSLLAMYQVLAVELCADGNRQPQSPHCRFGGRPIGHGPDEIAAKPYPHLRTAVDHRLDRVDDVVAVRPRRLEAEGFFELIEKLGLWFLVDAHRAVALHVGVAPHRADPGTRLAHIAAQKEQVDGLLYVCGAEPMLLDPHAVNDDDGVRVRVYRRHAFELFAR
jgi:hypothetical protein